MYLQVINKQQGQKQQQQLNAMMKETSTAINSA